MEQYYEERFEARSHLDEKIIPFEAIDQVLQAMRTELRNLLPSAFETLILLLDPDAKNYTRPRQCILYDRPVNFLSCKRSRPVVQKALQKTEIVVIGDTPPIRMP
jgi:hypothetical protein